MKRSSDKVQEPWRPELVYEQDDDGGQLGNLPLIHVPPGEEMPRFLLVWEAHDTGEIEPGLLGEDVPVVEWELRQYAQMDVLKSKLTPAEYDRVRRALGLKLMADAVPEGRAITEKIRNNVARTSAFDNVGEN